MLYVLSFLLSFQSATEKRPLEHHYFRDQVKERTTAVLVNSSVTAVIGAVRGEPILKTFVRGLAVYSGLEALRVGNYYLANTRYSNNAIFTMAYQIGNSLAVGSEDIRATYLFAQLRFKDGRLSVHPDLKPLRGVVWQVSKGYTFSVGQSLKTGIPIFFYDMRKYLDNTGYYFRSFEHHRTIGLVERMRFIRPFTLAHEIRHVMQEDLLYKMALTFDHPVAVISVKVPFVEEQINFFPLLEIHRLFKRRIPWKYRPIEMFAKLERWRLYGG